VEILKFTGTEVFANGFSAVMNTPQSTLKGDAGYSHMLYVWLNGTLITRPRVARSRLPEPEPKCNPGMVNRGLC
jgi:hypothetical protein